MQSMNTPFLSSLGARRTKHGFRHRTSSAMWAVAVLLAVFAVAVPVHRPVSADDPTVSITVSDPNHETATATITATGVTSDDWALSVNYNTIELEDKPPSHRKSHYMESEPTFSQLADSELGNMRFKSGSVCLWLILMLVFPC